MRRETELILALDVIKKKEFCELLSRTQDLLSFYKIGLVSFVALGQEAIRIVKKKHKKVFLDLKFMDIPNTMLKASLSALEQGVDILDFHLQQDTGSLKRVIKAIKEKTKGKPSPIILGVTVLTSEQYRSKIHNSVLSLSRKAKACGFDGVVLSGREAKAVRNIVGEKFKLVCPGIRLTPDKDDQKRKVYPEEVAGIADFIVVGRPIYESSAPENTINEILKRLRNS